MSERKPVLCPWCGGEMDLFLSDYLYSGKACANYMCRSCSIDAPTAYGDTTTEAIESAYAAATQRPPVDENTSDGYHTFKELYHHRAVLFAALIAQMPEKAWKSKQHSDGTMFDGMFIVGIETPDGQATYHYDIDPYWGLFRCRELDHAPEWDGHTPAQAIERIEQMTVRPPNSPLTLPELFALADDDAVWVVADNGKIYAMGAECAQEWASEEHCIFFSRKPTPEDIEAERKERNG